MPKLAQNVTTEDLLASLKNYLKVNLQTSQRLVSTVKTGLVDTRDELPMCMVLPVSEVVTRMYNNGLFAVDRLFRIDIVDKAYSVEEVKANLKKRMLAVTDLFSIEHLRWNLKTSFDEIQVYDFSLGIETLSEPTAVESQYTQYCSLPVTLSSYTTIENPTIPAEMAECDIVDLLDFLYIQCKSFSHYETVWKDQSKPVSMDNFPAIGVFIQEPDEDKSRITSLNLEDVTIIFRIYSSLATREVAFLNHLKNVETLKTWIFKNPSLDGRAKNFMLSSVDYGIELHERAYQGEMAEIPVFRSDITVQLSLMDFKHG